MKKYYKIVTIGVSYLGLLLNAFGVKDLQYQVRIHMTSELCAGTDYMKLIAGMDYHDTLVREGDGDTITVYDLNTKTAYSFNMRELSCQSLRVNKFTDMELVLIDNKLAFKCDGETMLITNEKFPGSMPYYEDGETPYAQVHFINGKSLAFMLKKSKQDGDSVCAI